MRAPLRRRHTAYEFAALVPAPYVGTYLRPNNSYVVRVDGGKLIVQDRPNAGGTPREYPVTFYGPDRVVVADGPDLGQSIELVRDDAGRVNWIRVVGRGAVRASAGATPSPLP